MLELLRTKVSGGRANAHTGADASRTSVASQPAAQKPCMTAGVAQDELTASLMALDGLFGAVVGVLRC